MSRRRLHTIDVVMRDLMSSSPRISAMRSTGRDSKRIFYRLSESAVLGKGMHVTWMHAAGKHRAPTSDNHVFSLTHIELRGSRTYLGVSGEVRPCATHSTISLVTFKGLSYTLTPPDEYVNNSSNVSCQ